MLNEIKVLLEMAVLRERHRGSVPDVPLKLYNRKEIEGRELLLLIPEEVFREVGITDRRIVGEERKGYVRLLERSDLLRKKISENQFRRVVNPEGSDDGYTVAHVVIPNLTKEFVEDENIRKKILSMLDILRISTSQGRTVAHCFANSCGENPNFVLKKLPKEILDLKDNGGITVRMELEKKIAYKKKQKWSNYGESGPWDSGPGGAYSTLFG